MAEIKDARKRSKVVDILLKDGDVTDIIKAISGVGNKKSLKKLKEKQLREKGKKLMDDLKGIKGDKIII